MRGGWDAWWVAIAATAATTAPIWAVRHAPWRQYNAVRSALLAAIPGRRLCTLVAAAAHQEHCCPSSHCRCMVLMRAGLVNTVMCSRLSNEHQYAALLLMEHMHAHLQLLLLPRQQRQR